MKGENGSTSTSDAEAQVPFPPFLAGGGDMGALMRAHDWSNSPLGSPETWPQSLRTTASLMLNSKFPMFAAWGPELGFLYNDAYAAILGAKHPQALGRPFEDVWSEIWTDILPFIETALSGQATWIEDLPLVMSRHGYEEETYFTFSYSPAFDDEGQVVGMFCACAETTDRVLADRRLAEEQERQRQMLLQMPGFVGMLSGPDLVYTYVNDAYVAISERTEFVGRRFRDVFSDIEGQGFFEVFEGVFHSGKGVVTRGMELRLHGREESQYVDFVLEPIRDQTGAVIGVFVGGYETTELHRENKALQESEARLRALAELSDRLRAAQDAEDIPHAAAEILGRTLGASRVGYGTIDDATDTLHVESDWTAPGVESLAGITPLRDYGSFVDSLKRDEFIAIADVRADEITAAAAAALERRSARSFVNLPVVERGRQVAVLYVNHAEVRDWRPVELALIREVAERARTAVQRHRKETELRESEERLRLVQAAGGVGSFDYDLQKDEAICSPEYYALFGLPDGYPINRETWPAAIHPDDREKALAMLDRAMAGRQPFDYEYRIVRADTGEVRWLTGRATILFDEQDRPWRYVGGNIDVTERRSAEERLRELNETLESQVAERTEERDRLWKLSEDMLARADYQGMMSAVSPAWTRVLGWGEAELLTRPYATFMHPDDMEPTLAALGRMGDTGQPARFENRIATSEGGWKAIEWSVAPEAEGLKFIAVGRDLSDVKAREAELAAAQEALRQSQKMEAVGQLTGGLAHDFNNLLAGISGSLEMMATRIAQGRIADVDRYMLAAQGAAKRAAALTHRLLAFSRRQTLEPKPTDVNRLVSGMEELIRRTVGPAIEIETVAKGGLWPVLADPNQLENALLNLCINARDAMPDGGKLTIETANRWLDDRAAKERDLSTGQYISLCVSDNGTGMPPDVVERAFDPFFTTKPIGVGTGLGLSMIYGFVRQSGGQVRIYSEIGEGTMVCIYLPRHHVGEEVAEIAAAAPVAQAQAGETVLVIDDEPIVRMLVADVLEDLGYTSLERETDHRVSR